MIDFNKIKEEIPNTEKAYKSFSTNSISWIVLIIGTISLLSFHFYNARIYYQQIGISGTINMVHLGFTLLVIFLFGRRMFPRIFKRIVQLNSKNKK